MKRKTSEEYKVKVTYGNKPVKECIEKAFTSMAEQRHYEKLEEVFPFNK